MFVRVSATRRLTATVVKSALLCRLPAARAIFDLFYILPEPYIFPQIR
jgi:hypothetical protein